MKFSDDFIFGGATAAYQCEGSTLEYGKGKVSWDDFLAKQGRFKADPASDFYHQYGQDLKLCNMFGINGIRISISWARIFPEGTGRINQEGVDFYHRVFQECHKNNVEPFVTLHHFDTPDTLYQKGDFLNRDTINAFVEFSKYCFEEYKNEVTYWFTFNEIWAVATNTYIEGTFPNGEKYNMTKAFQIMHNMMVAHALAVLEYKKAGYNGKIGSVSMIGAVSPQGSDFSEPVTQNTKRFVHVFWGLDRDLAYSRHYPAVNWKISYSEYVDRLEEWYEENIDENFSKNRLEIVKLLQEENELQEIAKVVGQDVLSDSKKLVLKTLQNRSNSSKYPFGEIESL